MNTEKDSSVPRWRSWRFVAISLACIVVSLPVAFGHSTPTAGYVHSRGVIVSLVTACCCAVCFFLSPGRPMAPKLVALVLPVLPLFSLLPCGGSTPPKLTAADRKQDIEFLARWARDYSPFVALNEKHKSVPSFEALRPVYLGFAEQAESNEEFFRVVSGYFSVIGASGHAYLYPEGMAKWTALGTLIGLNDFGISTRQMWAGTYWSKLAQGLPWRAHPPFLITVTNGTYFTDDDWQCDGRAVPRGSRIVKVNGMSCAAYLASVKARTHLRYDAFPKDWMDKYLLIIDESAAFQGWQVEFLLPDGTAVVGFVPKVSGLPARKGAVHTAEARDNCACLELSDAVAYVRIKTMGDLLGYVCKGPMQRDRRRIREFLERGQGRYTKLIIDIRNNGGGLTEYVFENLLRPFLDRPVTFKRTVGLKRKYLQDAKPSVLQCLKKNYAGYIAETREIKPPAGFAEEDWVFYEITTRLSPSERYPFRGKAYVLINGGGWSAADDHADCVKRIGLGTVVGQNTGGGGGAYLLPPVIRLPRSGILLRVEADLLLTSEGGVNELFGTEPDVKLPPADPPRSITREDLLKDPWIRKVIYEL